MRVSLAPDETIERIPIRPAQPLHRRRRLGRLAVPRAHHHRPTSGRENAGRWLGELVRLFWRKHANRMSEMVTDTIFIHTPWRASVPIWANSGVQLGPC